MQGRTLEPGTLVGGRFEVMGPLGAGGMGVVLRARDLQSGQDVALKFLSPIHALDPLLVQRFQREAELTARVDGGPGVIRVLELGEFQGTPFSAIEFCPGGDLADAFKRGLDRERLLELCEQLAQTLARCHAQNIIHRDVKPQNVLLDATGQAKLCDFGLALDRAERIRLTQSQVILGTPAYMAPEQADDARQAGPPADVYALGALLYEGLAGRRPYVGGALSVLRQVLDETPPELPSKVAPDAGIEPALDALVAQVLAQDPAARPRAAEFAEALARIRRGEGELKAPARGRGRVALGLILVVLALLVSGGARAAWLEHTRIAAARAFAMSLEDDMVIGLVELSPELRARAERERLQLTFPEGEEDREQEARQRLEAALVAGSAPAELGPRAGGSAPLRSLAEALVLSQDLHLVADRKTRGTRWREAWSRFESGARKGDPELARKIAREVLRRRYRSIVHHALGEAELGGLTLQTRLLPKAREAKAAGLTHPNFGWEADLREVLEAEAPSWEKRLAAFAPPAPAPGLAPQERLGVAELKAPAKEFEVLGVLLRGPTQTALPPKLQAALLTWLEGWVAAARPQDGERVAALATQLFDLSPTTWTDPAGLRPLIGSYLDLDPRRSAPLPYGLFFAVLRVRAGSFQVPAHHVARALSQVSNREAWGLRLPESRAIAYWDYQRATTASEQRRLADRVVGALRSDLSPDLQAGVLSSEARAAFPLAAHEQTPASDLNQALVHIRRARELAETPATLVTVLERELELEWAKAGYVKDLERAKRVTSAARAALEERLSTLGSYEYSLYRTERAVFWSHLANHARHSGNFELAVELGLTVANASQEDMPLDQQDLRAKAWSQIFFSWRGAKAFDAAAEGLKTFPEGMERQNPVCAAELALLLDAMGRVEEARAALERGQNSFKDDPFLRDVRANLEGKWAAREQED